MKKLIMLVGVALLSTAAYSQKFESGDKNLEMNFTPFGGNPISITGIKARMFNSESTALRLGVNLSMANEKMATGTTADGSVYLFDKESTFNLNLRPGYEKHLAGTDRLSPYFGAELDLALQTHKMESEREGTTANEIETGTTTGANGYFRFGINALAGFDYYFADKLYIGSEIGFGFSMVSNSDIEIEDTSSGFTAPDPQEQGSMLNIGPNFIGAIRLGYCF